MPETPGGHVHVLEPGNSPTTLVLLHGTGGDEHQLLPLGQALDPDATRLGVRGNVREGPSNRFFRRLAEGVFDTEDVRRRADDLAAFLRHAVDNYDLDPTRLVAVGFSNGANIAAAVLLTNPDVLRAAVLFSAMQPLPPGPSAGDLSHAAVLLVQDRTDPIAPPEQAEALAGRLADSGAAVDLRWHGDGHTLGPAQVDVAREWLRRWRTATAADAASSPP